MTSRDFDYCASVLRNPACSTRPGNLVCDDFTSRSRSGEYEFVKRKLRLLFAVYCKGLSLEKVRSFKTGAEM